MSEREPRKLRSYQGAAEMSKTGKFTELEQARAAYRDRFPIRDSITPDQQIAMAMLHNQDVGHGSCLAIAVILSKPTLRALLSKGLIDERCRLTKAGNELLKKWWAEAKQDYLNGNGRSHSTV